MSGNARGPSTAFNLLYRLCQVGQKGRLAAWRGALPSSGMVNPAAFSCFISPRPGHHCGMLDRSISLIH